GKLKLTDRVLDIIQPRPHLESEYLDPRWQEVTILQLLQHTGGWNRDKTFDPMFRSRQIANALDIKTPPKQEDIIRYMLGRPLDFDPGTDDAYSNFGYCLLGRVIEKVGGQPYGDHVRQEVLAPLGIRDMRLGKTLLSERAPHEVRYYDEKQRTGPAVLGPQIGEPVPLPYGAWSIETMDSHGGWIGSAVDLVCFASAFDDPKQ